MEFKGWNLFPYDNFLTSKFFVLSIFSYIFLSSFYQEFPFFTLTAFPPGFLVHVGGVVSARSVKLLDRIHNPGMFFKSLFSMFHLFKF